ncbi:MAG: SMP-30/gluconolactonase/LRE family protein [Pirellulales bacterium]
MRDLSRRGKLASVGNRFRVPLNWRTSHDPHLVSLRQHHPVVAGVPLPAADPAPTIAGIGPTGPIKKLHTSLQFTEGPAADRRGNLYFSDIPADRIYQLDSQGQLSVFLEPSHHTNGLMINAAGHLVACEMDGRIVEIDLATKKVTPLAAQFAGQRFNAPNDLVLDQAGGVYFTDPRFRAPMPLPQGKEAFYYLSAAGQVTRLGDQLAAPNGIILSPDEERRCTSFPRCRRPCTPIPWTPRASWAKGESSASWLNGNRKETVAAMA